MRIQTIFGFVLTIHMLRTGFLFNAILACPSYAYLYAFTYAFYTLAFLTCALHMVPFFFFFLLAYCASILHVLYVYTCFLCKYFHCPFTVIHMLFMQVFSSFVHGNTHASYASVFCRPYMMCTQIFISEFFRAIIWTMIPLGCFILHLSFESWILNG